MPHLTCALGPDCAGTLLGEFIQESTQSLDVAVYEVSAYYAWLLGSAAERGVRTRLLMDGFVPANATTAHLLSKSPVESRVIKAPHAAAHWKLLVRDERSVALGSGNLIKRDAPRDSQGKIPPEATSTGPGTREWWIIVRDSPSRAGQSRTAIGAVWQRAISVPSVWELAPPPFVPPINIPKPVVAPLQLTVGDDVLDIEYGGASCAERIARCCAVAASRILITVPYIHTAAPRVRELCEVVGDAQRRGADVRVLLGAVPERSDAVSLHASGLETRVMNPQRSTTGHAKGVVIDDQVILGSMNWSEAGLGNNLEAAAHINQGDAADYYAAAWERDWSVADPVEG